MPTTPEPQVLIHTPDSSNNTMTPIDLEALTVLTRLELYNRQVPCSARAVRRHLHQQTGLTSPPSIHRIHSILTRHGLTHGRTGWYPGDDPEWLPPSARISTAERRSLTPRPSCQEDLTGP